MARRYDGAASAVGAAGAEPDGAGRSAAVGAAGPCATAAAVVPAGAANARPPMLARQADATLPEAQAPRSDGSCAAVAALTCGQAVAELVEAGSDDSACLPRCSKRHPSSPYVVIQCGACPISPDLPRIPDWSCRWP